MRRFYLIILIAFIGITEMAAQAVPELMYYKFDVPGASVYNDASIPVGTNPGPVVGTAVTIGGTGQFNTALSGTGSTTASYLNTGWNTTLASGDWTLSFWINNAVSGTTLWYIFGDNGNSFRCFINGAPGPGNMRLTGTGFPNIDVTGVTGGAYVLHFVRETSPASVIKVYKNGVLVSTTAAVITMAAGTGLRIGGGYGPNAGLNGQMDEFRLYNRALTAGEISSTWNVGLPAAPCTSPPVPGNAVASNTNPCAGVSIILGLSGNSFGAGQTYQWESAPAANGPWSSQAASSPSTSLSVVPPPGTTTYYHCLVTCGTATVPSQPVAVTVPVLFPSGNYTINAALPTGGGNFHSFTDAAAAINCGIAGPVTFDVVPGSGPYNEQVSFSSLINGTATNTVTINGNGNTLTYAASTAAAPHTMLFNGADYITVNNLNIEGTGPTYALACHLWDQANNNSFNGCTFSAPANCTATTQVPFSLSGAEAVATTAGPAGNNNILTGCTFNSGTYNVCLVGNSTAAATGNQLIGCTLKDCYNMAVYATYQNGVLVRGNTIERPSRTTLTTFYGIYILTGCTGTLAENNRIRNPFGGDPGNPGIAYGIYSSIDGTAGNENRYINNIIYNMNGGGTTAGIYLTGADHVQAYHNTIILDNISVITGTTYGIYSTGTVGGMTYKNNNIYIARTGIDPKYCLYFSGAGAKVSNNNNLYIVPAANNFTGYFNTGLTTLADWQAANSNAWDAASTALDPYFTNVPAGDLTPGNTALDNLGTPVGVSSDILGAARSTATPDIGAYEFAVPVCSGTPGAGTAAVSSPTVCAGNTVVLNLSGFSTGGGIGIQWQSAVSGTGSFTDIPGATTAAYVDTVTASTDYQAVVTCSFGGGVATSNIVSVAVNPFYFCYCSPYTGVTLHGTTGNYITNVSLTPSGLNNTTAAVGPNGFTRTSPSNPSATATLNQTISYTLNVTLSATTYRAEGWIDWDQNGSLDATEYITFTMNGSVATTTITPPVTALTGMTGMRVRVIASTTATYGSGGACLNTANGRETEDYVITIAPPPTCPAPSNLTAASINATTASLGWTSTSSAQLWEIEYGPGSTFAQGTGTRMVVNTNPYTLGSLTVGTAYSFFVRDICGQGDSSLWAGRKVFGAPPPNDDAVNATLLTVGAPCDGVSYNGVTTGATLQAGEPVITCQQTTTTTSTVWYKFVAPASGMVRVSTDHTVTAFDSLTDSKIGIYSVADVNDFSTYQILGCDDDNGVVGEGYRNITYLADLTPGNTYYIKVDENNPSNPEAAFCIDVMPMDASMVSVAANCTASAGYDNSDWQMGGAAWVSMLDNAGRLMYNLKSNTSANIGDVKTKFYEQSGASRTYNGTPYLNRNYEVTVTTQPTQPIGLQFFFTDADFNSMAAAIPGLSMSSLNVTRLSNGACTSAYNQGTATATLLAQTGNGAANGVRYITTQTPGFSSFYIHANTVPLAITLNSLTAVNAGARNRIDWHTATEGKGDYFVVERSLDGSNYLKLGEVPARGEASAYSYWDASPVKGMNYYRLKLVDATGRSSYSATVSVMVAGSGGFQVEAYPNPVREILTVKVYGLQPAQAEVFVSDITGKIVKQLKMDGSQVEIDMSAMPRGVYLIRYTDQAHARTIKINKQ